MASKIYSQIRTLVRSTLFNYAVVYVGWVALVAFITRSASFSGWLEGWHRWDADWYLRIWMEGYNSDPRMLVFPPGFPYLIGTLSSITHLSFDLTALIFNLVCYFCAATLAGRFVESRFGISASLVFLIHLCSPVAFYAFMPYSDALFLLLFWLLLPLAVTEMARLSLRQKVVAGALMFLLPAVRLTAYALLVWAAFRRWFALTALLTLALFLGANFWFSGDPLTFLKAQKAFLMPSGWLLNGFRFHFYELTHPAGPIVRSGVPLFLQVTVLPLLSTLFLLFTSAWLAKRNEYLLAATVVAVALFSRNQFYWRSVLRYDWPLTAFTFLPWLSWVNGKRQTLPRALLAGFAAVVIILLIGIGLLFQLSVGRNLHLGGWAY